MAWANGGRGGAVRMDFCGAGAVARDALLARASGGGGVGGGSGGAGGVCGWLESAERTRFYSGAGGGTGVFSMSTGFGAPLSHVVARGSFDGGGGGVAGGLAGAIRVGAHDAGGGGGVRSSRSLFRMARSGPGADFGRFPAVGALFYFCLRCLAPSGVVAAGRLADGVSPMGECRVFRAGVACCLGAT